MAWSASLTRMTKRKQPQLTFLRTLPKADISIWSDGSAVEGTRNGGGGALIEYPNHSDTVKALCRGHGL